MKVPFSWLTKYVELDCTVDDLAEKIFRHSSEIDEIIDLSKVINNVVVGKITQIDPHPDADKLVICMVDIGNNVVQIVTGAKNVKIGSVLPVALDGATLTGGMTIKASKLRGVQSDGMMCSEVELGLSTESDGVLILPDTTPLGEAITKTLGLDDPIIDLDVLPNRGDLMSIRGVARECCGIYKKELKPIELYTNNHEQKTLAVSIEDESCHRYMGAMVKGVTVKRSPDWLIDALNKVGIKPINNIVDISNYVLFECGQPLHMFSLDKLSSPKIYIRKAKEGETIELLNDETLELKPNHLIIADEKSPIALAGIMGGKTSAIHDQTTDIILESAYFYPAQIRRTAFSLGLRTDSSQRFEKSVDFKGVETGFRRALNFILDLAGGEVIEITDTISNNSHLEPLKIELNKEKINSLLGTVATEDEMIKILTNIGFDINNGIIDVPSFRRHDVTRKADIAEEIGRFLGFDQTPSTLPPLTDFDLKRDKNSSFFFNNNVRSLFVDLGFNEVVSYSMTDPKDIKACGTDETVNIANPLSTSESALRPTLAVSLLRNLSYNKKNLHSEIKIFEIGSVFKKKNQTFDEIIMSAGLISGPIIHAQYENEKVDVDIYSIKGIIETLLESCGLKHFQFSNGSEHSFYHPHRCGTVSVGKTTVASFGQVHPTLLKHFGISGTTYYFQINNQNIVKFMSNKKSYSSFSLYPTIKRDISFWIDKSVDYNQILGVLKKTKAKQLHQVVLADIYDGDKHGTEKINYNMSFIFQASDKTLTDEEVTNDFDLIVKALENKLPIIFA
jgi:phenylalanyl-tRNA synthetase beta chain